MELPKDIYLYLTRFADDRTIFIMLSVNKKYNNDKFFEYAMKNKYPLLVQYNRSKEGWKKFFAIMAYCIARIERTHNIPYYHVEKYDPRDYYYSSKETILNCIMSLAARNGQVDLVKMMIKEGATTFDNTMIEAAEGGHKDIVELMIEKGATEFDCAMVWAATGGHKDIIDLMIQYGATEFYWGMIEAAAGGHQDIADYLKSIKNQET